MSYNIPFIGFSNAAVTPLTIISSVTVLQWVRGDLGITLATGVSAWADQSGNSNNFAQATGSAQPTYSASDATINNQATLTASAASSQQLVNTTLALASPIWISGIGKETSRGNSALWGSRSGVAETSDVFDSGGTGILHAYSGIDISYGLPIPLNKWNRFEVLYSTSVGYIKMGSLASAASLNLGSNAGVGAAIFSTTGGAFWNGSIAERVVCSNKPTAAEITALDNYFVSRYGFAAVFGDPLLIFRASNVLQWVRADLGITIGTGVSTWADQNTTANNYVQATGGKQPVYNINDATLNNLPSLTFDGVNDELIDSGFTLPAPGTTPTCILMVAKINSFTTNGCLVSDSSGVGSGCIIEFPSANNLQLQSGSATSSVSTATNTWVRIRANLTDSTADLLRVGATQTTGNNSGNTINAGRAIASAGGLAFGNITVFELVYLNYIPSATQLAAYDAYITYLTNGVVAV
jgi:hypothetical protein